MVFVKKVGSAVMAFGFVVSTATIAAAQDVKIDYDKAVDFSKYNTFSARVATSWGNPFGEKRALDEIEKGLVAKGWKKVEAASADATVMIHGATQVKKDLNTFYSGYGGYRYGGMGTGTVSVSEYTVGTMVVDIFDAKSKQLIWRGIGSDELSDADKNQKKIAKATAKMFKKFPPQPGT
jgi:hypothetical protein